MEATEPTHLPCSACGEMCRTFWGHQSVCDKCFEDFKAACRAAGDNKAVYIQRTGNGYQWRIDDGKEEEGRDVSATA